MGMLKETLVNFTEEIANENLDSEGFLESIYLENEREGFDFEKEYETALEEYNLESGKIEHLSKIYQDVIKNGPCIDSMMACESLYPGFINEDRPLGFFTQKPSMIGYEFAMEGFNEVIIKIIEFIQENLRIIIKIILAVIAFFGLKYLFNKYQDKAKENIEKTNKEIKAIQKKIEELSKRDPKEKPSFNALNIDLKAVNKVIEQFNEYHSNKHDLLVINKSEKFTKEDDKKAMVYLNKVINDILTSWEIAAKNIISVMDTQNGYYNATIKYEDSGKEIKEANEKILAIKDSYLGIGNNNHLPIFALPYSYSFVFSNELNQCQPDYRFDRDSIDSHEKDVIKEKLDKYFKGIYLKIIDNSNKTEIYSVNEKGEYIPSTHSVFNNQEPYYWAGNKNRQLSFTDTEELIITNDVLRSATSYIFTYKSFEKIDDILALDESHELSITPDKMLDLCVSAEDQRSLEKESAESKKREDKIYDLLTEIKQKQKEMAVPSGLQSRVILSNQFLESPSLNDDYRRAIIATGDLIKAITVKIQRTEQMKNRYSQVFYEVYKITKQYHNEYEKYLKEGK